MFVASDAVEYDDVALLTLERVYSVDIYTLWQFLIVVEVNLRLVRGDDAQVTGWQCFQELQCVFKLCFVESRHLIFCFSAVHYVVEYDSL